MKKDVLNYCCNDFICKSVMSKSFLMKYDPRRIKKKLRRIYRERRADREYQKWIKTHDTLSDENREAIRAEVCELVDKPLISVVLPVYNVEEKWLRLCIESVTKQLYDHWELCIADDCSPAPHVKKVLDEYAAQDKRIKVVYRARNGHISAASNSALELATGEFAALLDHDDELAEAALFYVFKEINAFPEAALVYSDEDMLDERGRRYAPKFKPDWSPDFFYSLNLVTHLAVYRTEILRRIGGFRIGAEGSQDYDLALRVSECVDESRIRHIPKILYHWRAISGSVALDSGEKPYAHERAREAIRAHLKRIGKKATVSPTVSDYHRVRYALPDRLPKVSLIIAADNDLEAARRTIESFAENTDYRHLEMVLLGSEKLKNALKVESDARQTIIVVGENQTDAERFNRAAAQTTGEILCFVDSNLRPRSKDWLKELVGFAIQWEIGAVGAKLLSAQEKILHAGLIIGAGGSVGAANYRLHRDESGYFSRARLVNNFSAVSVSCLALRREVFLENQGFDAENYPNVLFDADFCLRLREKKHRIVFTPFAELTRIDDKKLLHVQKKAPEKEKDIFRRRWQNVIGKDPLYNPNLSSEENFFNRYIK